MIQRIVIPLLLLALLCGCKVPWGNTSPLPPMPPVVQSPTSQVQSRVTPMMAVPPAPPAPVLIPVAQCFSDTNKTYSIYGGAAVSGPWTLLASNLSGPPAGTMDVPGYGGAGFYKITGN